MTDDELRKIVDELKCMYAIAKDIHAISRVYPSIDMHLRDISDSLEAIKERRSKKPRSSYRHTI